MVTYDKAISRAQPTAFIFTVDRSYSMDESIGGTSYGTNKRKADAVADALNRVLYELTVRCGREEGVRDYFHVAVVGYGGTVSSALAGPLAGRDFVPISEIADAPLRIEDRQRQVDDGAGGTTTETVRFPVWFEAEASGGTPMCAALERARDLVASWAKDHSDSFPPIVLNISDGEATDGSPESAAKAIQDIQVDDGNTLLFNLHLSSSPNQPVHFPDSEGHLADNYAQQLFRMSSVLPPKLRDVAIKEGFSVFDTSRGFVFNADIAGVVKFLDIGTRLEPQER
jgi:hypothetical protein